MDLKVQDIGMVIADICFGGNFYAFLLAPDLGVRVRMENVTELNYHRLKPMGWRSSAKSRLGRTSLINLEIIIFVSLQLTLFLYILDDYIVRYVSCSRCKIPASPKMLAPERFL